MRRAVLLLAGVFCTSLAQTAVAAVINVSLNTSALVADAADQPYSLEFELDNGALISSNDPGGPFTNASNIVTLSNFSFGGGFGLDPATDPAFFIDGGASGDIRSQVTLQANRDTNYFSQGFTPGSQLRFTITYTNNVANANILDSFDFASWIASTTKSRLRAAISSIRSCKSTSIATRRRLPRSHRTPPFRRAPISFLPSTHRS